MVLVGLKPNLTVRIGATLLSHGISLLSITLSPHLSEPLSPKVIWRKWGRRTRQENFGRGRKWGRKGEEER
jgi:hypothetical protein